MVQYALEHGRAPQQQQQKYYNKITICSVEFCCFLILCHVFVFRFSIGISVRSIFTIFQFCFFSAFDAGSVFIAVFSIDHRWHTVAGTQRIPYVVHAHKFSQSNCTRLDSFLSIWFRIWFSYFEFQSKD